MRVRGLKYRFQVNAVRLADVAPHAGAWIEIRRQSQRGKNGGVAPHAGAWIEIFT